MSTASKLLDQNKQNAIIAAQIETGKIVLSNFKKVVKPVLPMFVRGFVDHPLADFIIANLAKAVVLTVPTLASNKSLTFAVDSALLAASTEPVAKLGLPKLIEEKLDQVLAGVKLP